MCALFEAFLWNNAKWKNQLVERKGHKSQLMFTDFEIAKNIQCKEVNLITSADDK